MTYHVDWVLKTVYLLIVVSLSYCSCFVNAVAAAATTTVELRMVRYPFLKTPPVLIRVSYKLV